MQAIKIHADSVKRGLVKSPGAVPAVAAKAAEAPKVDSEVLKQPFGAATVGTDKTVTLENADLIVKLSTLGGKVSSVELKNYKGYGNTPLVLFDGDKNHFGLNFNAGTISINTDKLYITPKADHLTLSAKDSGSVTMRS